jgi:hypothetical protein
LRVRRLFVCGGAVDGSRKTPSPPLPPPLQRTDALAVVEILVGALQVRGDVRLVELGLERANRLNELAEGTCEDAKNRRKVAQSDETEQQKVKGRRMDGVINEVENSGFPTLLVASHRKKAAQTSWFNIFTHRSSSTFRRQQGRSAASCP